MLFDWEHEKYFFMLYAGGGSAQNYIFFHALCGGQARELIIFPMLYAGGWGGQKNLFPSLLLFFSRASRNLGGFKGIFVGDVKLVMGGDQREFSVDLDEGGSPIIHPYS